MVAVLALAAAVGLMLAVVSRPGGDGRFHLASCTIGGHPARCGIFSVPENPAQPHGKKIGLKVAVFRATGQRRRADPLVWFAGWGGAGVSDDAAAALPALSGVNVDRDLVFIDQRGTGSSRLSCSLPPAWTSERSSYGSLTAAARRCAAAIGPNLRYYTSSVAVDDFDQVRQALGYKRVNLYGGSYGVTTGQIYLLRHGRHVRSAVFDSGSLLDVHIFERAAKASQRALELLFKRCAEDTACSTAYPHLGREFDDLIAKFARRPVRVPESSVMLTPLTVAGAVEDVIAYTPGKNSAPRLIHLVDRRRFADAAKVIATFATKPSDSELAYKLLIQCSEPWASWRPDQVTRLAQGSYLAPVVERTARAMSAICKGLPTGVVPPSLGRRVHSSVPVLFLSGNEDGADPPSNIAHARRELPNSATVVFPRAGHGQLGLLCAQNLIAAFVERGGARGLDTTCAATAVQQSFDFTP